PGVSRVRAGKFGFPRPPRHGDRNELPNSRPRWPAAWPWTALGKRRSRPRLARRVVARILRLRVLRQRVLAQRREQQLDGFLDLRIAAAPRRLRRHLDLEVRRDAGVLDAPLAVQVVER